MGKEKGVMYSCAKKERKKETTFGNSKRNFKIAKKNYLSTFLPIICKIEFDAVSLAVLFQVKL